MREMEQAYRGSHSIKLNRNEQNMGITDHLEKVYSLASHKWVMRMDGDDRSFPHRCRILAEAIIKYPQARYIASDVELVVCESAGQAVWPAHLEEDKGLRAFLPQDGTAHRAFLGTASAIRRSLRAPYSEIRNLSMARTCMKLIGHGCMKDSWFCGTNSFCMLNTVPIFPGSIPG